MPVNVRSRYWALAPIEAAGSDGTPVAGLPIRPVPPVVKATVDHRLMGNETLESLAARFYGRSAGWWHIADANPLVFPLDWRPGAAVSLPQGQGVGRVLRTRSF